MKECFGKKLVRSRLTWAGIFERLEGERLTKRGIALRVDGRRRRGRPRLKREEKLSEWCRYSDL